MHREDAIRLRHIIEAAETAQEFITGRRRDDLDSDRMLLFALVRAIEIMGEAASRVSAESRSLASAVPWGDIIGMRNRLIHAYHKVDPDIVWRTATQEIPEVLSVLRTVLPKD
jgi:uncharacterized protein with HEPN domain